MNTILLRPTDVLFFRDGRPMGGSASGHGAAWPLPNIISYALHAALHRAELADVHLHAPGRGSSVRDYSEENRQRSGRKFGSLVSAGPFPVDAQGNWYFPRPADAGRPHDEDPEKGHPADAKVTLFPLQMESPSSLPFPLKYAVASVEPPSKSTAPGWWNEAAWNAYLKGTSIPDQKFQRDNDFSDTEHTCGIELSPETNSVVKGQFYSAHYLRLRDNVRLGVFASALDKGRGQPIHKTDLIHQLLDQGQHQIVIGGQQRICTAELLDSPKSKLPLPLGAEIHGTRVKWILLSPAIWPEICAKESSPGEKINPHPGGWLPNWIAAQDQTFEGEQVAAGSVLLLDGPGRLKAKRIGRPPGKRIAARLVAATVSKPSIVTGYATASNSDPEREKGGFKSTHLAVPAGAVYYFEADTQEEARKLAAALNWHGNNSAGTDLQNRRSTLMGEKGFGIGVCGTWEFHPTSAH